jgi:hypothetical protein
MTLEQLRKEHRRLVDLKNDMLFSHDKDEIIANAIIRCISFLDTKIDKIKKDIADVTKLRIVV